MMLSYLLSFLSTAVIVVVVVVVVLVIVVLVSAILFTVYNSFHIKPHKFQLRNSQRVKSTSLLLSAS